MTDELATKLTLDELARKDYLEEVIDEGLATFYEVGNALAEIRDSRLYREEYATFEDYCQKRWEMSKAFAYRQIAARDVMDNLREEMSPIGRHSEGSPAKKAKVLPSSERQARPLARLKEPGEQRVAWKEAVETAPKGRITAKHVEQVVERKLALRDYHALAREQLPGKSPTQIEAIARVGVTRGEEFFHRYIGHLKDGASPVQALQAAKYEPEPEPVSDELHFEVVEAAGRAERIPEPVEPEGIGPKFTANDVLSGIAEFTGRAIEPEPAGPELEPEEDNLLECPWCGARAVFLGQAALTVTPGDTPLIEQVHYAYCRNECGYLAVASTKERLGWRVVRDYAIDRNLKIEQSDPGACLTEYEQELLFGSGSEYGLDFGGTSNVSD